MPANTHGTRVTRLHINIDIKVNEVEIEGKRFVAFSNACAWYFIAYLIFLSPLILVTLLLTEPVESMYVFCWQTK